VGISEKGLKGDQPSRDRTLSQCISNLFRNSAYHQWGSRYGVEPLQKTSSLDNITVAMDEVVCKDVIKRVKPNEGIFDYEIDYIEPPRRPERVESLAYCWLCS
jgi:hypothetical protein